MTRQALGEEAARLGRAALMLNLPQLRTYVIPKCMLEEEMNHVAIAIIVARGGRLCSFVFFSSRWWDTLTPKHPSKACVSKPWSLGGAVEQICRMYLWEELFWKQVLGRDCETHIPSSLGFCSLAGLLGEQQGQLVMGGNTEN